MKKTVFLLVALVVCNLSAQGTNACIELVKMGLYDYFSEHSSLSLDQINIHEEARKFESIMSNWSKDKAEAHYGAIGGEGKFEKSKYEKLGKSLYLYSQNILSIDEKYSKEVKTINADVLKTFMECQKIQEDGLKFRISKLQKYEKVIVSLENDANQDIKITGIEAENFNVTGELWNLANDPSNKITPYEKNVSLIAERKLNNNASPCEVIAQPTDLIILTNYKNFTMPFPRIKQPCPISCSYALSSLENYGDGFVLGESGTKSINLNCPGALGSDSVRVIISVNCSIVETETKFGARTMEIYAKCGRDSSNYIWKYSGGTRKEFSNSFEFTEKIESLGNIAVVLGTGALRWGVQGGVKRCTMKFLPTTTFEIIPIISAN